MKYNTIRITPIEDTYGSRKWKVSYDKDSPLMLIDRVDVETIPHAQGHYHYPETMNDVEALKSLLQCMIKRHKEEIAHLIDSKDALEDLVNKCKSEDK